MILAFQSGELWGFVRKCREGDRGGNSVLTKQGERLHGLWDNFPGGDIKFATAKQRAVKFMDDPELQLIAMNAIQVVSIKAWFDESHALARDFAYNEEVTTFLKQLDPKLELDDRPKLVLTPEYLKTGGLIARERVVIAGYRLGHLLK